MPAKSKAQQALMAIAKEHPEKVSPQNAGVLSMSKDQLGDFASTPTKNLPKHKNSLRAMLNGVTSIARKIAGKRKEGK